MSAEKGEFGYRTEEDGARTVTIPVKALDVMLGGLYVLGGGAMFATYGNKFAQEALIANDWWEGFWVKFNDVVLDGVVTGVGAVVMAAGVAVILTDRQRGEDAPEYPAPPEYETFTARVAVYEETTEIEAVQLELLSETYTDLGDQA